VKGINGVPVCTGSTLTVGQLYYLTTASSPNPCLAPTAFTTDGSGNLSSPGGLTLGVGSALSGAEFFGGSTSGGAGFGSAAVGGSSTIYLMPTTAGSGNFLKDNGTVTCPSFGANIPASPDCEQLAWASASGTVCSTCTKSLGTTTGSSVASLDTVAIPSGYSKVALNVKSTGCVFVGVQFNHDTTTGDYYSTYYNAAGSAGANPNGTTNSAFISISSAPVEIWTNNYDSSDNPKIWQGSGATGGSPTASLNAVTQNWNSASAITSATVVCQSGTFTTVKTNVIATP
jgi:hypothetical protein